MQMLSRWNRRRFLRAAGIGAAAGALAPFVPMLRAEAGDAPPPRRFVAFTGPMASNPDLWRSNGTGAAFVSGAALPPLVGSILAPLAGLEEHLTILDGLDIECAFLPVETEPRYLRNGHHALPSVWTGMPPIPTRAVAPPTPPARATDTYFIGAGGASLDQVFHARARESAPHLITMQLGCWEAYASDRNGRFAASYGVPGADGLAPQLFPTTNPRAVFDRVFGTLGPPPTVGVDRRAQRRAVLGLVRGEMVRLRAELPFEDRERLDGHHQSLVELEARLAAHDTGAPTCTPPEPPRSYSGLETRASARAVASLMFELIRLAFECDLMRSVSFLCGTEVQSGAPSAWDPALPSVEESGHVHELSHRQHEPAARQIMVGYNRAQIGAYAELVRTLAGGANTLADTIVAYGGGISDTELHLSRNPFFLVAAGENVPVRRNHYQRWGTWTKADGNAHRGGVPHSRLLTTLAQGLGMSDVERFGHPGTAARPIDSNPLGALLP